MNQQQTRGARVIPPEWRTRASTLREIYPNMSFEDSVKLIKQYNGDLQACMEFLTSGNYQPPIQSQPVQQNMERILQVPTQPEPLELTNVLHQTAKSETIIEKMEESEPERISLTRLKELVDSIHLIAELETNTGNLGAGLEDCLKTREIPVLSHTIRIFVDLLCDDPSRSKVKLDVKSLKRVDGLITEMKKAEENVKNGLTQGNRQELIGIRNRVRGAVYDALNDLCPKLQASVEEHEKVIQRREVLQTLQTKRTDPVEKSSKSKDQILQEYFEWMGDFETHVSESISKTNRAYQEFVKSLEEEKQRIQQFVTIGNAIAKNVLSLLPKPDEKVDDVESSSCLHLNNLLVQYRQTERHLQATLEKKNSVYNLKESLQKVVAEQRDAKRNLLRANCKKGELELDGASLTVLQEATLEVEKIAKVVSAFDVRIDELEKELHDIRDHHYPEIEVALGEPIIPYRYMDSKLLTKRSFKDYQIIKKLSPNVNVVKYGDHVSVCKAFKLDDEKSRKLFLKEINALSKLAHPCIAKIECFFVEEDTVYVLMEYYEDGNLKEYLEKAKPSQNDLRYIFNLLAQAIKHIHDRGIVHCDLKLENIVMTIVNNIPRPVIIDFDISRDLDNILTKTLKFNGTGLYLAPEVMNGGIPGKANDIWAFGCIIMKAHFPKTEVVLLPEQDHAVIPTTDQIMLKDLLACVLKRDPDARMTAEELVTHGYFNVIVESESLNTTATTETKLQSLKRYLQIFSRDVRGNTHQITLRRSSLVEDVLTAFKNSHESDLLRKLRVTFQGENGSDAGGLTTNMYTTFFKEIVQPKYGLFESGGGTTYLPSRTRKPEEWVFQAYEVVGKLMIKSVYDQRVLPEVFPSSLLKYFLGLKVNFRDLEIYDNEMAQTLNHLIPMSINDMCLDFDEFGAPSRPVTDKNKYEYFNTKIQFHLVTSRRTFLEAMKSGWKFLPDLDLQLINFNNLDLQLLLFGQDLIEPRQVTQLISYQGDGRNDRTKQAFFEVLNSFSSNECRKFLEFVTGGCGLPKESNKQIIIAETTRSTNNLPIAHVCSFQLDLPKYDNVSLLRSKLMLAIENGILGTFELA